MTDLVLSECKWLPPIIDMESFEDYKVFIDFAYSVFKEHYLNGNTIKFKGTRISYKRYPEKNGYHSTFWHLTTFDYYNNQKEEERLPDMQRCERIRWPKAIILNHSCDDPNCDCNKIKVWEMVEKGDRRIKILYQDQGYLVVLSKRSDYILLWTAFQIDKSHRLDKYIKQYERFK